MSKMDPQPMITIWEAVDWHAQSMNPSQGSISGTLEIVMDQVHEWVGYRKVDLERRAHLQKSVAIEVNEVTRDMIVPLISSKVDLNDMFGVVITDAGEFDLYYVWPGDGSDELPRKLLYKNIRGLRYSRETRYLIKKNASA